MKKSLLQHIPSDLPEELFETIAASKTVQIKRIVSRAHSSLDDFWYDQQQNEFVLVVQGSAKLRFDDGSDVILNVGDYLIINAHQKHRVEWTDDTCNTIWLAVYF